MPPPPTLPPLPPRPSKSSPAPLTAPRPSGWQSEWIDFSSKEFLRVEKFKSDDKEELRRRGPSTTFFRHRFIFVCCCCFRCCRSAMGEILLRTHSRRIWFDFTVSCVFVFVWHCDKDEWGGEVAREKRKKNSHNNIVKWSEEIKVSFWDSKLKALFWSHARRVELTKDDIRRNRANRQKEEPTFFVRSFASGTWVFAFLFFASTSSRLKQSKHREGRREDAGVIKRN